MDAMCAFVYELSSSAVIIIILQISNNFSFPFSIHGARILPSASFSGMRFPECVL